MDLVGVVVPFPIWQVHSRSSPFWGKWR